MLLHIFVQLLMEHRRKNNRGYSSENVRNPVKKNVCLLKGLLRQDIQGKTADRISILMKYFPNLQVVGWFAALPDVTTERMQYLRRVHLDNFAGNMKTMYLINKAEKYENFYLFENGDLKKQKGYVCFYERNYEMQEYMLQKRGVKSVEAPEKDKVMKSIRAIINEKEEQKLQKKMPFLCKVSIHLWLSW